MLYSAKILLLPECLHEDSMSGFFFFGDCLFGVAKFRRQSILASVLMMSMEAFHLLCPLCIVIVFFTT